MLAIKHLETLAAPLYRTGDLFLMPSSFEPCGISQMLAMRVGVPCVVHGTGGLRDTVENRVTGFVFEGRTPFEQAIDFIGTVQQALEFIDTDADAWRAMRQTAAGVRPVTSAMVARDASRFAPMWRRIRLRLRRRRSEGAFVARISDCCHI